MQIRLVDGSIPTTPGLLEFVHTHLSAALDRFSARIRDIRVHIADVNGHRRGVGKRCTIYATVGGAGVVITRRSADDFYEAIGRAIHALKEAIARRVERTHAKRHGRA